jgi:hypothetical protein
MMGAGAPATCCGRRQSCQIATGATLCHWAARRTWRHAQRVAAALGVEMESLRLVVRVEGGEVGVVGVGCRGRGGGAQLANGHAGEGRDRSEGQLP